MTPPQIATIRTGFQAIALDADGFAAAFYDHLFDEAPSLRALFSNAGMKAQRAKLVAALVFVVRGRDVPGCADRRRRDSA